LARALNEKNRYIGMAQGAISGATGVVGAAADIPLSMILALRTVYLTGRAYGFELNQPEDRAMIFEALSNADLSLITEKQAILIGLNSVSGMLGTGNIQGLQTMLGSSNDFEPLFKLLSDANGQLKWRISAALLDKVTPVIGGAVGAIYTSRLLKEVSDSAKQVFEHARQQGAGQGIGQDSSQQAGNQQPLTIEDKLVNAETPVLRVERRAGLAESVLSSALLSVSCAELAVAALSSAPSVALALLVRLVFLGAVSCAVLSSSDASASPSCAEAFVPLLFWLESLSSPALLSSIISSAKALS
jgi:hypothetical protein